MLVRLLLNALLLVSALVYGIPTNCTFERSLKQKWTRLKEWIESEGGYLHPSLELGYIDKDSFERGFFATNDIVSEEILAQLPITTVFSQFVVSKFIEHAPTHPLFSTAHKFMPKGFPDWKEFLKIAERDYNYDYPGLEPWLALGFAWIRKNTLELDPWFDLLPEHPNYLPFLWPQHKQLELFGGTEAFRMLQFNEKAFNLSLPYIDLLGLTHDQVKEAFALIVSRSFGSDWENAGGAYFTEFMCGLGYGNHKRSIVSNVETPMIENVFHHTYVEEYMLEHIKRDIGQIDYSSIYWYIESDIKQGEEVFNNYGNHHNSAEMLALFGFMDDGLSEEDEFYTFHVEVLRDDKNYAFKQKHFEKYWPQQDILTKHPGINYGRSVYMSGQKEGNVPKKMAKNMRLTYLPNEYFDSFTISSIINSFERRYLKKVIDPLIEKALHRACAQLLEEYPTNYDADERELVRVKRRRKVIAQRMKNKIGNIDSLQQELWDLEMMDQVLRYRMREMKNLMDCGHLRIFLGI